MEYKVVLSPKKIVSKEFKVDFKGYNADEVDHFLDQVVKDYEAFAGLLNNSYDRIEHPSLEVITIFFRTTFKPFLSICRFYRLFLYF